MFQAYWPAIALVAAVLLVVLILTLGLVGNFCGARNDALPDRDLKTYLPDHNDNEEEDVFAATSGDEFPPQSFETVDIMMQPQGVQSYEPGIPYPLDASMSPEGRREFEIWKNRITKISNFNSTPTSTFSTIKFSFFHLHNFRLFSVYASYNKRHKKWIRIQFSNISSETKLLFCVWFFSRQKTLISSKNFYR
jgi:hypothetical protein